MEVNEGSDINSELPRELKIVLDVKPATINEQKFICIGVRSNGL